MMSSALSTALCVLLLTVTIVSVAANRQDPTGYCFRHRTPIGKRGKCRLPMQAPTNSTGVVDAAGCCTLGGVGWSLKSNGKRCIAACPESDSRPLDPLLLESVMESLEAQAVESSSNAPTGWSAWSDWSECTACTSPSNQGIRHRMRECLSTGNGNAQCPGSFLDIGFCTIEEC